MKTISYNKNQCKNNCLEHTTIIVGAGPAGISTWLHLHKYAPEIAEQTIMIDKAVFPRDKLCAGGVSSGAESVLNDLEVELDIPSVFVSDIEFRCGDEQYNLHWPDCFRVVQRIEFDCALVKTAKKRGLQLNEGESLVDAVRDGSELVVESNRRTYRVKAIIGADGPLSRVRRIFLPHQGHRFARTLQVFAPTDLDYDTEFDEKKIVFDFSPIENGLQGYVYHFPCLKEGMPSIAHGIVDMHIHKERPKSDIKTIFSRELQARNIHVAPTSWSSHPIRWLSMEDNFYQPNVILAGEAAGIDPALCEGIHIALSCGSIVANTVIDAFKKNDFSFSDYKEQLASHNIGKHIRDSNRSAREMYSGIANPLTVIQEMFSQNTIPPAMISQMVSEIASKLL